jgi:DNA relaxase NicK
MVQVSPVFIDWVTAVSPTIRSGSWLRRMLSNETTTAVHKAYHRELGLEYYPSAIRHYHSPHAADVPSIIVMDGAAMGNLRDDHDNDWANKVVAILARNSSHFSRIDLAVDVFDEGKLAREVGRRVADNSISFGRRQGKVVMSSGDRGGTTAYVGSRTSPLYLRIYDKWRESKGKILSSRIEFELKAECALQVFDHLSIIGGWLNPAKLFTGYLNQIPALAQFPEIESLMIGDVISVDMTKRERMMETKEWLRKQIMPTFTRDIDGKAAELWAWFKAEVDRANSTLV